MTNSGNNRTKLPVSVSHKIDQLCDKFEQDFGDDNSVRIERYLQEIDQAYRSRTLEELLPLEIELRGKAPAELAIDEFAERFPGDSECLARIFQPIETPVALPNDSIERVGSKLGPYLLIEAIGKGGMGVVYLAEQQEPVRRQVALKIIKPGMDTGEVLARFEAERQALALMDHPGIARVLDAGATDSGRPYFVMELVQGDTITEYCDKHKMNSSERLNLFIDVCRAIQHAHQKGIIHRDIKPGNVLVTESDGNPVAKVIDFGLAKATEQSLTEKSIHTQLTQILGTPLYMSPEQADTTSTDVDTRTDIYSLGVLLYELLTGLTPIDEQKFRHAAYDEMRRIIREEEPSKPSTRISSLGDSASDISDQRLTDPKRLSQCLRGDLDWIVMKALDKDRERRYETANGFASDIQRYLDDEPVLASPPSKRYRMQKFVRRNRVAVLVSSLVAFALVLGFVGTTWGMFWALDEKKRADLATKAEVAAKEEVQKRADELQQVSDFQASQLSGIDVAKMGLVIRNGTLDEVRLSLERSKTDANVIEKRLGQLDKQLSGANFANLSLDTLKTNIFDRALTAIDEDFEELPLVQASLYQSVGNTLRDIGLLNDAKSPLDKALKIRQRELGDDNQQTIESLTEMCHWLMVKGKFDEMELLCSQTVDQALGLLGDEHLLTLTSKTRLAYALYNLEKHGEAELILREVKAAYDRVLVDDHGEAILLLNLFGDLFQSQKEFDKAELYFRDCLTRCRIHFGNDHVFTATLIYNLGFVLDRQQKYAEAYVFLQESLTVSRQLLGDNHPKTIVCQRALGDNLASQGKFSEAEPLLLEAVERSKKHLGSDHHTTLVALSNLVNSYNGQGKIANAISTARDALKICRQQTENSDSTIGILVQLGNLLLSTDPSESERIAIEASELVRLSSPQDDPSVLALSQVLLKHGRFMEAKQIAHDILKIRQKKLGKHHPRTGEIANLCGVISGKMTDFQSAESFYLESVNSYRNAPDETGKLTAMNNLARLYINWEKPELAEPLYHEVLGRSRHLLDENELLMSTNNLAETLLNQNKLNEASSVFRDLYELLDTDSATKAQAEKYEHKLGLQWINQYCLKMYQAGKPNAAIPYASGVLDFRRRVFGDRSGATLSSISLLALLKTECNNNEAAEKLYLEATEGYRILLGEQDKNTLAALHNTASFYLSTKNLESAEPLAREALNGRRITLGDRDPNTIQSMWILGELLVGKKDFMEAETLLIEAFEKSKDSKFSSQHLANLYFAWDKEMPDQGYDEKKKEWQSKLESEKKIGGNKQSVK